MCQPDKPSCSAARRRGVIARQQRERMLGLGDRPAWPHQRLHFQTTACLWSTGEVCRGFVEHSCSAGVWADVGSAPGQVLPGECDSLMACRLSGLITVPRPWVLAPFWCEALNSVVLDREEDCIEIGPREGFGGPRPTMILGRRDEPEKGKSRLRIDVNATDRDQDAELERLLSRGTPGRHRPDRRGAMARPRDPGGNGAACSRPASTRSDGSRRQRGSRPAATRTTRGSTKDTGAGTCSRYGIDETPMQPIVERFVGLGGVRAWPTGRAVQRVPTARCLNSACCPARPARFGVGQLLLPDLAVVGYSSSCSKDAECLSRFAMGLRWPGYTSL